jgi:hypothetical protein
VGFEAGDLVTDRSRWFWPAVVVGWSVMAVGAIGVAGEGRDVPPFAFARWIVGIALVHDLVLVPICLAVGVLLQRALRSPWRGIAGTTLLVAAVTVLFAWPYVMGWGRLRSNPSIHPREYGRGLTQLLATIALGAVVAAGVTVVRRARDH